MDCWAGTPSGSWEASEANKCSPLTISRIVMPAAKSSDELSASTGDAAISESATFGDVYLRRREGEEEEGGPELGGGSGGCLSRGRGCRLYMKVVLATRGLFLGQAESKSTALITCPPGKSNTIRFCHKGGGGGG